MSELVAFTLSALLLFVVTMLFGAALAAILFLYKAEVRDVAEGVAIVIGLMAAWAAMFYWSPLAA